MRHGVARGHREGYGRSSDSPLITQSTVRNESLTEAHDEEMCLSPSMLYFGRNLRLSIENVGEADIRKGMDEMIQLKRAHDAESEEDGARFLVERLRPRGIKKENLTIEGWLTSVAPTAALRRWFNHDPGKWVSSAGGTSVS